MTNIEQLRALLAKATEGKWQLAWEDGKHGVLAVSADALVAIIGNNTPEDGKNDTRKANGLLMAALHNAAPELLDELEAARAELAEARRDSARLDWLLYDHAYRINYNFDDRASIDAAMQAESK